MMRNFIFYVFLAVMPIYATMAGTVSSEIKEQWGYADINTSKGAPSDFVIVGGTGTNGANRGPIECSYIRANQTAAYGAIGVVARRVVKHGAYFCPTQVVCDSRADRGKDKVYFAWYNPARGDADDEQKYATDVEISTAAKCKWLCDDGYFGPECSVKVATGCEKSSFADLTKVDSIFGYVKMRRNHDRKPKEGIAQVNCSAVSKIDSQIALFDTKSEPAKGVVLGVIKFLEHGVIAAPVKLECSKRKDRQASLSGISLADGNSRVLCAKGYRPADGDCVVIDQTICEHSQTSYCDGFPSDKYNASMHVLNFDDDNCIKYFCIDNTKAFASGTDTTCSVPCATDSRSGVSPSTGVCEKCAVGQVFSKTANKCVDAIKYTKEELLYGKEKYTETKDIKEQCWTLFGDFYTQCVTKE